MPNKKAPATELSDDKKTVPPIPIQIPAIIPYINCRGLPIFRFTPPYHFLRQQRLSHTQL